MEIEQVAEADIADDQAREHDLANTSAPMPANPKHIDITISIAIHSHIFWVNMLPNMMKFAALEQKTHEVIASASPQPWIARAEDQYPRLGLDASVQEKHETPIRMEGNVLPKPQATRQWPWDRGGSGREKDRAGG